MLSHYLLIVPVFVAAAVLAVKTDKLTPAAGLTGYAIAFIVYAAASYTGIAMLATFFVLATGATSWGLRRKQAMGLAEKNQARRTAGQVIANAAVAAILGLLALMMPHRAAVLKLMIAASFASATADTLSSELGVLYGKRFYNIMTFKPDTRGLDGVISVEGTLIGMAGTGCIAMVYAIGAGFNTTVPVIVVAGTIGSLLDSVLGATVERKQYLGNNSVNFANTAVAALAALIFNLLS